MFQRKISKVCVLRFVPLFHSHNVCMKTCGPSLFMSPEAFDEAKSYTAKLDIIFGVIVIQIFSFQIQLIDFVLFMILAIT